MSDNQRYYDTFDEAMDDAGWNSQLDYEYGVDAVVAAVREDLMTGPSYDQIRAWHQQEGRQAAAQDIRADRNWPGSDHREYYARIAEGTQS